MVVLNVYFKIIFLQRLNETIYVMFLVCSRHSIPVRFLFLSYPELLSLGTNIILRPPGVESISGVLVS